MSQFNSVSVYEFIDIWYKSSYLRLYKRRKKTYKDISYEDYYKFLRYNNIRIDFLCKMFNNSSLSIVQFKRTIKKFISVKDFKNWKSRLSYISEHSSSTAITKEKLLALYGNKNGKIKWDNYVEKQRLTNTFEYKHAKYGISKEEFDSYNKSRAVTLQNMIRKYGEIEGTAKFKSYCELQKSAGCSLDYFKEKYGDNKGLEEYKRVNDKKKITLQNMIRKYGEVDGKARYYAALNLRSQHNFNGVSNISKECFDNIIKQLPDNIQSLNIQYKTNTLEEYKIITDNSYYSIDFIIHELKLCIEFNGDYWHANPILYSHNEEIHYPNNVVLLSDEIWERDLKKIDYLEKLGYCVYIIWERDYRKNFQETIKKCINFITERYHECIK